MSDVGNPLSTLCAETPLTFFGLCLLRDDVKATSPAHSHPCTPLGSGNPAREARSAWAQNWPAAQEYHFGGLSVAQCANAEKLFGDKIAQSLSTISH